MALKWTSLLLLGFAVGGTAAGQGTDPRRNILIIMTDEQSADALSAVTGNRYLRTPHMDALAARGLRFTRAYCANPLCTPSRSSMFTGRYPHELKIMDNEAARADTSGVRVMGQRFGAAGYETGYVGKWHVPAFPLQQESISGFQWTAHNRLGGADSLLPQAAISFIGKKRSRPFLLVVSFVNPHNICEWSRGDALPDGPIGPPVPLAYRPPLPANQAPTRNESDINRQMREALQRNPKFPVGNFTAADWRAYRWAYYRLVEKVDGYIGRILEALKASGQEQNTLIVFLSDHGDMQGAHRWNQKTVFYEEAARVPLILAGPGLKPQLSERLVNTGIDLIPTLCGYAGIGIEDNLPGENLLQPMGSRPYIVVANRLAVARLSASGAGDWKPEGRMLRSRHFKYWIYDRGAQRESLFDMDRDPGEMQDLARLPAYRTVLEMHRHYLSEWATRHQDAKALDMLESYPPEGP